MFEYSLSTTTTATTHRRRLHCTICSELAARSPDRTQRPPRTYVSIGLAGPACVLVSYVRARASYTKPTTNHYNYYCYMRAIQKQFIRTSQSHTHTLFLANYLLWEEGLRGTLSVGASVQKVFRI